MSPTTADRVAWRWEWVPAAGSSADLRAAWTAHLVELVDGWAGEHLAAARSAWPADAPGEAPFTAGVLGGSLAAGLLDRADALPGWARLAWGATFVDGGVRWAPTPVVVEFHRPVADDPGYLMEQAGAEGLDGDVREPVVEYVSTPAGDGLVVFALGRGVRDIVYGRVDAALRLTVPPAAHQPATEVDVLLRTMVFDLAQMAVIGPGMELLMNLIATDSIAEPGAEPARLRFATASQGGPS